MFNREGLRLFDITLNTLINYVYTRDLWLNLMKLARNDWRRLSWLDELKSVVKVISDESDTNYNVLFRVIEIIYLMESVL